MTTLLQFETGTVVGWAFKAGVARTGQGCGAVHLDHRIDHDYDQLPLLPNPDNTDLPLAADYARYVSKYVDLDTGEILDRLSDEHGLMWLTIARVAQVSVPAMRKWRHGGNPTMPKKAALARRLWAAGPGRRLVAVQLEDGQGVDRYLPGAEHRPRRRREHHPPVHAAMTSGRAPRRVGSGLLAVLALLSLAGCGDRGRTDDRASASPGATNGDRTELAEPCPGAGATVELGSPYRGEQFAEFDAQGGTVYVTVRRYQKGGVFDPEVASSRIYIGPIDQPPTADQQSGRVSNVLVETSVVEGTWSAVDLPVGRFWLWTSNGTGVEVRSCEQDGVSGAKAA